VSAGQEYELAEQWFADRLGVKVTITAIPLEDRKQASDDTTAASIEETESVAATTDFIQTGYRQTDG